MVAEDAFDQLKKMLEVGLRPRLPREKAFIAKVVDMVRSGTLPRALVESTFLWAKRKKDHPFPHFEHGLRLRARRVGIAL